MNGTLIIAELRHGAVRDISRELVAAGVDLARRGAGPVTVAVVADDPQAHVAALSLDGVDELLLVEAPGPAFEAHVAQHALEALIEELEPTIVLLGHTVDSYGFAPAVAARKGLGFASDVIAVELDGGVRASRAPYAGKLAAQLELPAEATSLLTIRPGAYVAVTAAAPVPTRTVAIELGGAARTEHVEFVEPVIDGVDISTAAVLVSVGRGIDDEDQLGQFDDIASQLGGALSVSRPIVDAGWAPAARQVGQSGRTVKPKVYLAFGISGAVQHLAGIREADTIIAVNTDPDAPIMGVAKYAAVADMFDVADALQDLAGS